MSIREIKAGAINRILSAILVFSMLICALPLYINSVSSDEEYDLPWLWPVPGSYVITGLDYYYSGNPHGKGQAIDIGNNGYSEAIRLDVISATTGEVLYIQDSYDETENKGSGWGNYVIVRSGNVCIVYAHLQKVTCKYGSINAGDVIGKMGNTGDSTGVHLHMQAYPSDQNSTSTDIYVFDKYITNPLYVPSFSFRSGVIKYSERYGQHLSAYYTSLEGLDHVYTGGYFGDYGEKPLGASVKSVRTNGARIYASPIKSLTEIDTVEFGEEIEVYSYYYDGYGELWYLVSENSLDKWIPESDVGFYGYKFGAIYEDKSSPSGIYGTYFDIYFAGRITVQNVIKTVRAEIRSSDAVVASCEMSVNSNEYEINNAFSSAFDIKGLDDGEYTYEIFVSEAAYFPGADAETSTYSVFRSDFVIDKTASDNVPPLVEEIRITSVSDSQIDLSVTATDNEKIQHLAFVITDDNGFELSIDALPDGNVFSVGIPIADLNGTGKYTVKAIAYDPYMNSDESHLDLILPSESTGEVWKVQVSSSLSVRSSASASSTKIASLKNNALITVTEISYNASEGRFWGYIGNGWCAMEYAVYQSGYLYSVAFNLLDGEAEISELKKAFKQDAQIPSVTPTRTGYNFLGWSSDPSATTPEYQPGDTYSADESAVLYAIWEDKTAPTITDVTMSEKGYVADSVTITVNASDNSGTIYYSFDGGISYRRAASVEIYENQILPAGTITVKDPAGNVTAYDLETVISNIDDIPPSLDDTTLSLTVDGDKVTFVFGEAIDEKSGVDKYILTYSSNPDFSGSVSEKAESGHTVTLGDGVYYAKLTVTDKVGNKAEQVYDRFLVGSPVKLSTPENFVLKSSSGENAVLEWSAVNNADYYILTLSESPDHADGVDYDTTDASITLSGLENGKVYYAFLVAATYDGVYTASDPTEALRFETVSSDNKIYGFNSIDVVIDGKNIASMLPYSASSVDISCTVYELATVRYYTDSQLSSEITAPNAYSFSTDRAVIYVEVTAENGDAAVYVLTLTRASLDAELPTVNFEATGENLYVGYFGNKINLTASVTDGGTLTAVWYMSLNGQEAIPFANGFTCTPRFTKPGNYKVYAVVTNTNDMCQNTVSTVKTAEIDYTVLRNGTRIDVVVSDITYNGSPISPSYVYYDGDGNVTYKYYSDADCHDEIDPPINVGTYYVKAFASETDTYEAAESVARSFTINPMQNTDVLSYTVVMPTLRNRFGTVEVDSDGVEYSVNSGDYVKMEPGKAYTFNEGDTVRIRYAAKPNVSASKEVEIYIAPFSGTDDVYPSSGFDAVTDGEYFIINEDTLTANLLLSKLEKSVDIEIRDKSGVLMNGSGAYIYSGCRISVVDSVGVYKAYTIIILGDLDRDGTVTYDDVTAIMKLSNGMTASSDPLDELTCDLDGDGRITSLDSSIAYAKTK